MAWICPSFQELIGRDKTLLDDLRILVEQPSISACGEGIMDCANLLADVLKLEGFDVYLKKNDGSQNIRMV